jgi:hypothetical protein
MRNKISIILVFCVTILLCVTACNPPDISEYQPVSGNIVWNEGRKIATEFPGRRYYEIEGVPTDEYIACKWRQAGKGAASYPLFMKHKDFNGNWELDASSAELIISKSGLNLSDDEWSSFGQSIIVQEVHQIDGTIAEQLASSIVSADYMDYNDILELGIHFDGSNYIRDSEGNYLRLRFPLKEHDALSWIAYILVHDGTYYIEINEVIYKSRFLLCDNEFASIIDKVCDEYDLN